MSLESIRTALQVKLVGLTDINNVKDYIIWTDEWAQIFDLYATDGRFDSWFIGVQSNPSHIIRAGDRKIGWLFNIVGYYSIKTSQESSKQFETNIETIINGLSTSFNVLSLNGVTNNAPALVTRAEAVWQTSPAHTGTIQITFDELIDQELACKG